MNLSRRGFLSSFGSLIAAPAIVRATSLMPVRAIERFVGFDAMIGPDWVGLTAITRNAFLPHVFAQWKHHTASQLLLRS